MSTTSYYLYQKYISVDGGEPTPAYPAEYSYDGEGTMPPVVKEQYDTECGQVDTYRWVDTDDFICEETYSSQYLTIESLENGNTIEWRNNNGNFPCTISASTDNGTTWTAYTSTSGGTPIASLNAGDKVLLKGLNERYFPISPQNLRSGAGSVFCFSKRCNVYGNIMSLVSGDNFTGSTSVSSYAFTYLFYGGGGGVSVVNAKNLILPATTLASHCYDCMFSYCTSLTTAPELPATTLAEYCYWGMFHDCTSLTTAPSILPATTLALRCYTGMFHNCTSLTTAPVLPATTLANYCYTNMFNGCTSLNYIKCLATDISANSCTVNWVLSIASSGTFVKSSSMNNWTRGSSGIPNNWTVQNA